MAQRLALLDSDPPGREAGARGELRTIAGIDEAGLGPLLGPLTLGFSVFRAPASASENLWRALDPLVSTDPLKDRRRFVVADSKVVFKRTPRCEKRLESTALGFLTLLDRERKPARSATRFLWETPPTLAPDAALLAEHPWYPDTSFALPHMVDADALELKVERLSRKLREREVELADAGVCVLPEAELNRSFHQTENKALTHWHKSAAILRYLWERFAHEGLRLSVDRHGGRSHYAALLEGTFPDATVECLNERPSHSEYVLEARREFRSDDPRHAARRMRISFAERAEQRSFPVALGSCLAKYAREVCMHAFNDYFCREQPELKPTAGYNQDGRRWLRDAQPALERCGVDAKRLVRER